MSYRLSLLRASLAAAVFAAVSVAAVAPSQACEVTVFISTPTTLNDPVECVVVSSETPIEGDITNNTQIGNAGGDIAVSVIATTVTGRFINNGLIIQDGPTPSNVSFATFDGANIASGIVNNGTIRSTSGVGMSLGILLGFVTPSPVTQTGAIDNFGIIDGGLVGFDGIAGTFTNTLWNHAGGSITGTNTGVLTEATFSLWTGGLINDGAISGANAVNLGQFNTVALTFSGGIRNGATGTMTGTTASSLVIFNTLFSGGIVNDGTISGQNNGIIAIGTTDFSGGIVNGAAGVISGNLANGINIQAASFGGDIDNAGRITSTAGRGIFVPFVAGSVFNGDIFNRAGGVIEGATGGIEMRSPDWQGNLSNAGTIGTTSGDGVFINNSLGVWDGDVVNDGLIQGGAGLVLDNAALHLEFAEWNGGVLNTGTITGPASGFLAGVDVWNGDFDNRGSISGVAGVGIGSNAFTGNILNSASGVIEGQLFGLGICNADCQEESVQTGVDFLGALVNSGDIVKTNTALDGGLPLGAVTIFANSWTGDIVNETGGLISSPTLAVAMTKQNEFLGEGVDPLPVVLFEGDFINRGTIEGIVDLRIAQWTGDFGNAGTIRATTGDAVHISNSTGTWDGSIVNDGLLQGGTDLTFNTAGLHVDIAEWNGGVTNRGTITSPVGGAFILADIWNGSFDNSGRIGDTLGLAGAFIGSQTFTGDIINRTGGVFEGQLEALTICGPCDAGPQPGVHFIGNFFNSGRMSKTTTAFDDGFAYAAIIIFANTWTGDIVNDTNGLIESPTNALRMAKQNELFGDGEPTLPVDVFNGNFINRGTIRGAIELVIADWNGHFENSGSIVANGPTALRIIGDGGDGIFNSGVIRGAIDLSDVTTPVTYRQTGAASETGFPFGSILLSDTAVTTLDFQGGRLFGLVTGGIDLNDIFEVNAGPGGEFEYVTGIASNLASFAVNSGTAIIGDTEILNVGSLTVGAGASLYLSNDAVISAGNVTFAPTSTLEAVLTPNTAVFPSITVSGTASLAGSFVAHIDPLAFAGSGQTEFAYNGLISGPVTGTFSSVTIFGAPNLFTITPIYNSFDLLIELQSFAELAEPESPNQVGVGEAIDEIYEQGNDDPDLVNLIETLAVAPEDTIGDILDSIAGSTQAETQTTALKSDDPWKQSVGQRVNAARSTGCTVAGDTWCFKRYAQAPAPVATDAAADSDAFAWLETGLRDVGATSLWGRVVGVWGKTDGGVSSPGSQQQTYGLVGGADHVFNSTLLLGVAGQYVRTKADFESSRNESLIEAVQGGAYFSYGGAELYVNGNASVIGTRSKTNRFFSVGAIDYNAAVRFPSTSLTGSLEVGKIFEVDGYRLEPNLGMNYAGQFTDPYREDGAGGLGLIVDPDDLHSLRSMVGGRVSRVYDIGDRKIVPEIRVEWRHEYLDRRHTFQAAFQGAPDTTFFVSCEPSARDTFALGTSMTVPLSGRLTGFVDAEGAFSDDARSGTLSLGARATW